MKKKIVEEVDVTVKIVESKRCFKLRVENDTRLKTIANKLCCLMHLDPFTTEWAFYKASEDDYEIPIAFTIRQISEHARNVPTLLAKIMTTTLKQNYFVVSSVGWKVDSHWRKRIELGQNIVRDASVQTDNLLGDTQQMLEKTNEPSWYKGSPRVSANTATLIGGSEKQVSDIKKPKVVYTMYGIQKPESKVQAKKVKGEFIEINEIWKNLKTIEESMVMRGLNVVGYCPNHRCVNYMRWISVSLGFGR